MKVECPTCIGKGEAMFSCCTGEAIFDDSDLCPTCYEHMGEEECIDCHGTGKVTQELANELEPPKLGVHSHAEHLEDNKKYE